MWFKKNKHVELPFWQWVFVQHYGFKHTFKLAYNPFLMMFINLCLYFDWFSNDGKFKPGDKVKYNLFARVMIPTIEEIKGGKHGTVYTVVGYPEWSKSKSNCDYIDDNGEEGSCAVFWLKKVN